ncbi:MAG TPA: type I DNA topoisomerase [Patescibacteria group bacterium]|jgi:DNA topoisomerase-1|nr:type I DNA topoisomerase [Patescibacteria group bacterium]
MKTLVVVESPTKAKTIGRFLGDGYEIVASMGHIMDLPKSTLGIDVEKNFAPDYQMMADKKKVIAELKSAAKTADKIILATDPDREGEAIAAHIKELLAQKSKVKSQSFKRIAFHEITKEAIEEALKSPRAIDENLVDAQTARRVLDRLVGYKLSPILWRKVRRGLSAGRVQSVALRLIVEREREIEKFKKENYWTIAVNLSRGSISRQSHVADDARQTSVQSSEQPRSLNESLSSNSANKDATAFNSSASELPPSGTQFELIEINGQKIEVSEKLKLYDGEYTFAKTSIDTEEKAKAIEVDLKTKEFKVSDVTKKEMRRSPPPPYTTSTLQQDAARRMGMSGKRTMSLAQKLYEEGFITYHRTDSVAMASSAVSSIRNYVEKEYGAKYIPVAPRLYKAKQKLAQEAHEAIRPTNVSAQASAINDKLGAQYAKLYEIIWRRAVSTQMEDAITESTVVLVTTANEQQLTPNNSKVSSQKPEVSSYLLKANGSVLVFDGFLKVNPFALNDNKLPDFTAGENLDYVNSLSEAHVTMPPPRYNDASIIKALEEEGIGRPSTYATIISTIESRQYIERNEGKFLPTSVGFAVNDFLVTNFSTIDDIPFTAQMEDELDEIANGKKKWSPVIKQFYDPFEKTLEKVGEAARVKIEVEKTSEICPLDGGHLIIRIGRFGKFMACENFPECKFTKAFSQDTGLICPKDGGKIVFKKTKKGRRFYGCSNYPKCDFASWKIEDIKNPKGGSTKESLAKKEEARAKVTE